MPPACLITEEDIMNLDKERFFVDAEGKRIELHKLSPAELGKIMALMRHDPSNSIPDDAAFWLRIYFESNPAEWPPEYLQALECKQVEHDDGSDRMPLSVSFMQMFWAAKCFVKNRYRQLVQDILKEYHIEAAVTQASIEDGNVINLDVTVSPGEDYERIFEIKQFIMMELEIEILRIVALDYHLVQLKIPLRRDS